MKKQKTSKFEVDFFLLENKRKYVNYTILTNETFLQLSVNQTE